MPSRIQQVSILVLAAGLVAAGVAGGQWFMQADYVVFGYLVSQVRRRDIPVGIGNWMEVSRDGRVPAPMFTLQTHSFSTQ